MCFATASFVTVHIRVHFAPMDTCRWEEQHEYVISYLTRRLKNYRFEWIIVLSTSDRKKGKAVPLQARSGPEGSRKLRFSDFVTTAQDGGRLSGLRTGRLYS